MTRWAKALCLVFCLVATLAPFAGAAEHFVQLVGITFDPPFLEVGAGDKVTWVNGTIVSHSVTSGTSCTANGIFNSGLFTNSSFSYTFPTEGSFPYFCIPHCGLGMRGQVKVNTAVPVEHNTWGAIKDLYKNAIDDLYRKL